MLTAVPPEAANLAPEDSGSHPNSHPRALPYTAGKTPAGGCPGASLAPHPPLRSTEDCIGVPGEEVSVRLIDAPSRHADGSAGRRSLVEFLAITPVRPQARADQQRLLLRVNPQVATVKQGMDVDAQQQAVVDPVLAVIGHGADVGRLQHRNDLVAGRRATPTVGLLDECLEDRLADPDRGESGLSEDLARNPKRRPEPGSNADSTRCQAPAPRSCPRARQGHSYAPVRCCSTTPAGHPAPHPGRKTGRPVA